MKRMSGQARTAIVAASNAAALVGAEDTEAEHFLLAFLTMPPNPAQAYLLARGFTRTDLQRALEDADLDVTLDEDDKSALAALGFDVPALLDTLEERFGSDPADTGPRGRRRPGPRRLTSAFGRSSIDVIKQAALEAAMTDTRVGTEHLLLAVLQIRSPVVANLMDAYGVTYEDAYGHMFPPPQQDTG